MDSIRGELRADVLTRLQLEEVEGAEELFTIGTPNEQQMAELRRRGIVLLDDITAEQLFTWSVQAINNRTFAHAMWMDESSLANFVARANSGKGIPYLRDHNTRRGTTGRVYQAVMIDDGPAEEASPADGAVPTFRDVFRDPGNVYRVYEQVYTFAPGEVGDPEEADHIRKIGGGQQASNSIGFGIYGPMEPGSFIECDYCKVDLFRVDYETCPHLPGLEYEVVLGDEDDEERETLLALATAKVVNAQQNELSGVYLGAVPDTFTERGIGLYRAGLLSQAQARQAERTYQLMHGAIVGDRRSYSIPVGDLHIGDMTNWLDRHGITRGDPDTDTETAPKRGADRDGGELMQFVDEALARIEEVLGDDRDRMAELEAYGVKDDPVKALVRLREDELGEARKATADAVADLDAFKKFVSEKISLDEGDSIGDGLDRLVEGAKLGEAVRDTLVAELAKQMTRAGIPTEPEHATKMAAHWSVEQLKSETERYKKVGDSRVEAGRKTDPEDTLRHRDEDEHPQPRRRMARV